MFFNSELDGEKNLQQRLMIVLPHERRVWNQTTGEWEGKCSGLSGLWVTAETISDESAHEACTVGPHLQLLLCFIV